MPLLGFLQPGESQNYDEEVISGRTNRTQLSCYAMKVLVVSKNLPGDFRTKVHGVYQRLRMFLEGIQEIASIDMLFYVASDLHVSPSIISQVRRSFLEHWNIELKVFLFPAEKFQEERNVTGKLRQFAMSSTSMFQQPGYFETSGTQQIQAFEVCLGHKPDAIFVDRLQSMAPLLLTKKRLPPVFFNMDDIEHVAHLRNASKMQRWRKKVLSYSCFLALWFGEYRAIRLAEKTFICSELDRQYLAKYCGIRKIATVSNAVSIPAPQPLTVDSTILFIGSYTYKPNIEAAEFLIQKIWPKLYKEMPTAKLIIAGAYPERISGFGLEYNGIEFSGFVEDLEELYAKTKIVCTPILTGAGTRVKIIEAAAYGKPIVSTSLGAEGLDLRDGLELFVKDDPDRIVEACLQLLRDTSLCERMGNAARTRTIQLYDKQNIIKLIQKYLVKNNESTEISGF